MVLILRTMVMQGFLAPHFLLKMKPLFEAFPDEGSTPSSSIVHWPARTAHVSWATKQEF
jgi:hypothetical protein